MRVDAVTLNPALVSLFDNPNQIVTLDANFLIPPDRHLCSIKDIPFPQFKDLWLNPIFDAFPNLAIHEAVHEELLSISIKAFIQSKLDALHPGIIIHKDSSLTRVEQILRDSIEAKIYPHTRYEPQLDNRADRGEVKTLSFIAVKGLIYFAAHDHNAIQLIEKAESWSTGLDTIQVIKMYEIIFYLYTRNPAIGKPLRMLYKYQYYLTEREKDTNPEWSVFIRDMQDLYHFQS
jgi:hypothetical protein